MRNYVMTTIAVLLLSSLSFGLILSFNLIEQDRKYLDEQNQVLDAKYNTIQAEVRELEVKTDKVLMLMAVYRDGINTLKQQIDGNASTINTFNEALQEVDEELETVSEMYEQAGLSATGGYGVLTSQTLPPPANFNQPVDEPIEEEFTEEDFVIFEEEDFEEGTLVEEVEEVEELEILTPLEPAPVFACPVRDKSVDLNRYIRRLEFAETTTVVLNYDVVEGKITNMFFTDIKGNAGNRLFEALERYLLASAIIEEPEGRACRLPFRIVVE